MNCPNCAKVGLIPESLDSNLLAKACPDCGGHWIGSNQYFRWLSSRPKTKMGAHVENDAQFDVVDVERARLCPECSRIMLRYRVGKGIAFYVDRCGDCGGLWLDKNEWQALKARELHDDLHYVFSAAWQDQVRNEELVASREDWLVKQLGEERYRYLREIKEWLEHHPHRSALIAYLKD